MAAALDQVSTDKDGNKFAEISAHGLAPITRSSDFLIGLNGTLSDAAGINRVSDAIDGAFFEPPGAAIGGVYQFNGTFGKFVGTKGP